MKSRSHSAAREVGLHKLAGVEQITFVKTCALGQVITLALERKDQDPGLGSSPATVTDTSLWTAALDRRPPDAESACRQ